MKNSALKNILNNHIQLTGIKYIYNNSKYNGIKKCENMVTIFLNSKSIYDWLSNSSFDLVYSSETFLNELCILFNIKEELLSEISEAKNKISYISGNNISICKVEVQYKWFRTTESITMLSLVANGLTNIYLKKEELYQLTEEEEYSIIKQKILFFHNRYKGFAPIFGKIEYYLYTSSIGKIIRLYINEASTIEKLSNTDIVNEFYFKIIEQYGVFNKLYEFNSIKLDNILDLLIGRKINLITFIINMFNLTSYKNKEKNIEIFINKWDNFMDNKYPFIFKEVKEMIIKNSITI